MHTKSGFYKRNNSFLFAVILWKFTDWVVQQGDVHKAFELTYESIPKCVLSSSW